MTDSGAVVSKTWSVQVDLGEHEGMTRAVAHLHTGDRTSLTGTGTARAPAIANALCSGLAPKSIQAKLIASKVASATI